MQTSGWRFSAMARVLIWTSCLAALAGVSACGPSRDDLRDGALSLIPPGSTTVKVIEGDCVELARSPSCVHIYYVRAGTLEGRTTAVQRAARDAEWTRTLYDVLPGGTQLGFLRDRLRAAVFLELDHSAAACRRDPKRQCADVVMVEGTQ